MRATAEVRWFYAGSIRRGVEAWFDALEGGVEEEEARTDLYLRPTDAALSVKHRAFQLEVKRRDVGGEEIPLGSHITGRLEHWRKWSFPLEASGAPDGSDRLWIAVNKARRKRTYRVLGQAGVEPASGDAEPARGCNLELARVEVGRHFWWSLCFEAYGEEEVLRNTLVQTARRVFSEAEPPGLSLDHSFGYAAWLKNLFT